MKSKALIELHECRVGWERPLLPPLSFSLEKKEYLLVAGPNGAGKTTLVKTMLGMLPPLSGEVRYPDGRPRIGYVPQRLTLPEHYPLTAREVVLMGRTYFGRLGNDFSRNDRAAAAQALSDLGIASRAEVLFGELSGGQKQRVLVARAIAAEVGLLVLDEPTVGMDNAAAHSFASLLDDLRYARGFAVVAISHDLELFLSRADTVCRMEEGSLSREDRRRA